MVGTYSAVKNPFAQSNAYQMLTVISPMESVSSIEMALEELALSIAHFEHGAEAGKEPFAIVPKSQSAAYYEGELHSTAEYWRTDIVVDDSAKRQEAETRLRLLQESGVMLNHWQWENVQMRDWVSEIQSQFPPLEVGRFYIHGSHLPPAQKPKISLQIDAGCAFGTGEHATTAGCLRALAAIARKNRFKHVLDLGCGTGILAIAAQKLWPEACIKGSDMDAVSVRVAKENSRKNGVPAIRFYTAPGFCHPQLKERYNLIFANILARPLVHLAGEITHHLQPGGFAILSGLLENQALEVLHAYRNRGMQRIMQYQQEGWMALVLVKH